MSFRTRLQTFADTQQKIQIWYGMGCHNTITGRVLAVDHDHVDIESYNHESDGQIHVRRILVPMHLILHIDITSAETNEGLTEDLPATERAQWTSESDINELTDEQPSSSPSSVLSNISNAVDGASNLESPRGYHINIWSRFSAAYADHICRLTAGPGGIYMTADNNIWLLDANGQASKYLQLRTGEEISGLCFHTNGMLFVATTAGGLYKIDSSRKGRILTQLDGRLTGGETFLHDTALGASGAVFVSNCSSDGADNNGGIFRVNPNGDYDVLVGGIGSGVKGLLVDQEGHLWSLEHDTGALVKRSMSGQELSRIVLCAPGDLLSAEEHDGNLTIDSLGRIYVTAGRSGRILRVTREGLVETFLTNLIRPTGITFGADGSLFVIESGRPRVLRISAIDKADRTTFIHSHSD
jgi:sugar lactone lactonase YvrE